MRLKQKADEMKWKISFWMRFKEWADEMKCENIFIDEINRKWVEPLP